MVSEYENLGANASTSFYVLILVLVEDGLRDEVSCLKDEFFSVLILVLVEDGLRVFEI